ncbi:MAG: DNA repair protein RecN [Bdellovibrionales bacterium]
MLTSLTIQNVVLIERLDLRLTAGLNVFTGETGAGKSILMDALALALGARADAALVRNGTSQAAVTACFEEPIPPELAPYLEEQGLSFEEPVILRRTLTKEGKSRAFINDQPVSITMLKQVGSMLLEIHGQFETHGLLNPATHQGLLDAFAGTTSLCSHVAQSYKAWQKAKTDYDSALALRDRSESEAAFLRSAVTELDELAPEENEIDQLTEKRKTLQHREKILDALATSKDALQGKFGADTALIKAGKALARIADKAEGLDEILTIIDRAAADSQEACARLTSYAYDMELESESLETIEERLFRLRAIARKHNVAPEALGSLYEELSQKLALLEDQAGTLIALGKAVQDTKIVYEKHAKQLNQKRQEAAKDMAAQVEAELKPLKLERAVFTVDCEVLPEEQWSANGMNRITFLIATNPGSPAGALHKVASGGELARFMLALKVVLRANNPAASLVFDEVDSGIGGATASAVGDRLARLGQHAQILVITHSPQVAARGKNHLKVEKQLHKNVMYASVAPLDKTQRLEEIARMLAGSTTTDAARQAALSLLEDGLQETKEVA